MNEFLEAVASHAFMRNALLTGVLASVACGVMGSFVVIRRISYVAGGIAHCVLGGIGAALYLQRAHGWDALDPIYGALVAAVAAALVIGLVSLKARQRVDTVIGAVWAIGMATGILFLSKTPGYGEDLMSYLFGNILMVTGSDLWLMVALDVVVVVAVLLLFKQLQSICFDEEFSRVRGLNAPHDPGRGRRPLHQQARTHDGGVRRSQHHLHDRRPGGELRPQPPGRRDHHRARRRNLSAGDDGCRGPTTAAGIHVAATAGASHIFS